MGNSLEIRNRPAARARDDDRSAAFPRRSVYEGGVSNHPLAPEHVQRFQPHLAPDTKSWVHMHSPHLGSSPLARPPEKGPDCFLRGESQAVHFARQSVPQFSHVHTTLASLLQDMLRRTTISGIQAVPARLQDFSPRKSVDENLKQQAVIKWLLTLHELEHLKQAISHLTVSRHLQVWNK